MKYEVKINSKILIGEPNRLADYIYEICGQDVDQDIKERAVNKIDAKIIGSNLEIDEWNKKLDVGVYGLSDCLLYTSPSPRDATLSRMPSSA